MVTWGFLGVTRLQQWGDHTAYAEQLKSQNILRIDRKWLLVLLNSDKRLKGLVNVTAIDLKWCHLNLAAQEK